MRRFVPTVATAAALLLLARAAEARTVGGRVVGEDGQPLAGVAVQVTEAQFTEHPPRREVPRSVTDMDGRFLLRGVPDAKDLILLLDVCVPDRALLRLDLKALPEPLEIEVPAEGRLAGRVVGPDGAGFPGASVIVQEDIGALAPSPCATGSLRQTVVADAEGRFALERLSPGRYSYVARAEGYSSGLGSWVVEPGPDDGGPTLRLLRELPVELTSPDPEEGNLPENCRIVEPVPIADGEKVTLSGRIVGLAPGDLTDAKIYAWSAERGYVDGVVRRDGTYRIPSLAAGDWEVRAYVHTRHVVVRTAVAAGEEPKLDVEFPAEPR